MIRARIASAVAAGVALSLRVPAAGASFQSSADRSFAKHPLYFVQNRGQLDPRVSYFLAGRNMAVYFTDEGFAFALTTPSAEPGLCALAVARASLRAPGTPEPRRRAAVALDLVGARRGVKPEGREPIEAGASYFTELPADWRPGDRTYASVVYREVWPGIDLSVDGSAGRLEYTFTVKPGADPGRIRMRYRGAVSVRLDGSGALEVATAAGSLSDQPPYAYQERNGRVEDVAASYELRRDGADYVYSFDLGKYDRRRPLVIDPVVLAYCGYIGGSGYDEGYSIAVDAAGSAYVTGPTFSSEATFPVAVGPDLTYNGGTYDAFLAKVKPDGTGLVYAGYIGGSGDDQGYGIAVDAVGNAYVTGWTTSSGATFPVAVGPDLTYNGGIYDAFVARVKPDGTGLVYCGYIGGSDDDVGKGIAVDTAGSAYVTGQTWSSEATFPVAVGPDLTYNGGGDAFVAKVKANGTGLVYCGYIGGSGGDEGYGIALDAAGNADVTGYTWSSEATFPVTLGPELTYSGGIAYGDAFVASVKVDGTGLVYCGYVGGSGDDIGYGIGVDAAGSAYVAGVTNSTEATFPVAVGPDLTYNGSGAFGYGDAFVAKVKADGTGLVYTGYIGGSRDDEGYGIAVDAAGSAYVTGEARSPEATFPVAVGPDLSYNDNGTYGDAFVAKVKADGTGLVYAGYIGGSDDEYGQGIAVDAAGNAYVTGQTDSTEATFPVTVGPDLTFNGSFEDAFVAKVTVRPCLLSSLVPPGVLRGGKDGLGGARFQWGPDPNADQYHLNSVTAKGDLRDTDPTSPRQQPQGRGVTECTASSLSCSDADALADPRRLLYYQVLSACGDLGSDEGPMCPAAFPCP